MVEPFTALLRQNLDMWWMHESYDLAWPDESLLEVVMGLVKRMRWTFLEVIGADLDKDDVVVHHLKRLATQEDVCLVARQNHSNSSRR